MASTWRSATRRRRSSPPVCTRSLRLDSPHGWGADTPRQRGYGALPAACRAGIRADCRRAKGPETQKDPPEGGSCAGIIDLLSNQDEDGVTVDRLRDIGRSTSGDAAESAEQPELPTRQPQCLSKRLSADQIDDAVRRYREGESARSIAIDIGVAPSALVRLLREKGVTVQRTRVTAEQARQMAKDYEAGSTMREIEARYGLSHGAVYRALHQVGFEPRSQAPRPQS